MPFRSGAQPPLANRSVRRAGLACLLVVLMMWAAGCGGGDSSSSTETTDIGAAASKPNDGASAAEGRTSPPPSANSRESTGAKEKNAVPQQQPEGEREPPPTPQQRAEATVASITLESPSLSSQSAVAPLPSAFTCDGKDTWPSLRWSGVPSGTAELALLLVNTQPVNEKLFIGWAIAGLDPGLGSIESGELPRGVIVGRNSVGKVGYSLCPPAGTSENYFFMLYALPESLGVKQGFDPVALRTSALEISHNAGLLPVSYSRQ